MDKTIRLTVGQAVALFLQNQYARVFVRQSRIPNYQGFTGFDYRDRI